MRRSEEHVSRVTEPRFSATMRKAFPILRGFNEKLRQGTSPIRPAPFEVVEAKREERKANRKAEIRKTTRRNKRRTDRWWL